MKTCPFCAEQVQDAAILCKHCGSRLDRDPNEATTAPAAPAPPAAVAGPTDPALAGQIIGAIAGVLCGLGALLPWLNLTAPFGSASANGLQGGGDGIWTLIAGVLILTLAVVAGFTRDGGTAVGVGVLAVICGIVVAIDLPTIQDRIDAAKAQSSLINGTVGAGVFVTFVGAGLALLAAFMLYTHKKGRVGLTAPPPNAPTE